MKFVPEGKSRFGHDLWAYMDFEHQVELTPLPESPLRVEVYTAEILIV